MSLAGHGEKLLGEGQKFDRFPLLLKILDAKEDLSIQVHPNEETAPALKGEPKTEMWYAIEKGSVYAGFKKEAGKEEFLKAIQAHSPQEALEKIEMEAGEAVYIPGGKVHAICAGSLLFEVQQNSNTTYRIYDWGRGNRPLHTKEALEAIDWYDRHPPKKAPQRIESDLHHQFQILADSPFFIVDKIDVFDHWHIAAIPKTFQIYFFLKGEGSLTVDGCREEYRPGMTFLVPASAQRIELEGKCEALRIRLP
ncbi:MAG: class I mannose-6-phosphate isomerase [Acidobacteriia bacterium]|nr:class I mannose-6-phosphate isomerase [Terriglobia bacterium]